MGFNSEFKGLIGNSATQDDLEDQVAPGGYALQIGIRVGGDELGAKVLFEGSQGAEGAVTPYVDGWMDDLYVLCFRNFSISGESFERMINE